MCQWHSWDFPVMRVHHQEDREAVQIWFIHHMMLYQCHKLSWTCNQTIWSARKISFAGEELLWTYIENNVWTRVTNCFSAHKRAIFVFVSWVAKQRGNKHKNDTRVRTETVHHESTYTILFLTRYNKSINDDKNDDLYTSSQFLARSSFCWWRHNQLLMTSK